MSLTALEDYEFEDFDPIAAALDDPELEIPKFTTGNMKLDNGRNEVRFVPKRKGIPLIIQVVDHWITKRDGKRARYACRKAHMQEDCPICDKAAELFAAGMTEQVEDIKAKGSFFGIVIDMKKPSLGAQLLRLPWSIYTTIVGAKGKEEDSFHSLYGDFSSSKEGYPIFIIRTEENKKVSYTAAPNLKAKGPFDLTMLGGKPIPNIYAEKCVFEPEQELYAAVAHLAPATGGNTRAIGARNQQKLT